MKYRFKPTESFWESFYDLNPRQKDSTRRAWNIFKQNPFDPRLRTHKIHRLSAHYSRTIYAVDIEGDLRAVFYLEGMLFTASVGISLMRAARRKPPTPKNPIITTSRSLLNGEISSLRQTLVLVS